MSIIQQRAAGFYIEREGEAVDSARALRVQFDVDVGVTDFIRVGIAEAGLFSGVQSIYVDNADYAGIITLVFRGLGQRIVVPPSSQGYFTITDQSLVLDVIASAAAAAHPKVWFYNMPLTPNVWRVAP